MFTSLYLLDEKVIPSSDEVVAQTTVPAFSNVFFGQGYKFEAVEHRISLEVNYPQNIPLSSIEDGHEPPDYLQASALNLVKGLKYLQLVSVGINFTLVVENGNLQNLLNRFPQDAEVGRVDLMIPNAPFRINCSLISARREDPPSTGVLLELNFDGQVTDKTSMNTRQDQVTGLIMRRNECFQNTKELINVLAL
jgi:hypothetical protein